MAKIVKANEIISSLLEYFAVSATIFGILISKIRKIYIDGFFLTKKIH